MTTKSLSYEQLKALTIMRDTPDLEGSEICTLADCSFDELIELSKNELIVFGSERIRVFAVHPVITELGRTLLKEVEVLEEIK